MRFATIREYAEKVGFPVPTIRRLCQSGELPAMQIGRRYYIDTQKADAAIDETVQVETARKKAVRREPEMHRGMAKDFDFLKAVAES